MIALASVANERAGKSGDAETAGATAMIRVDALRKVTDVIAQLGGDPQALLAKAAINPDVLSGRHAVIPYLSLVELLRQASIDLSCPDFGMRLAAFQEGAKVLGPLEVAMRNSETLRAAYAYCASYLQVYSTGTKIFIEEGASRATTLLRFHVQIPESLLHPQSVEHALLLAQHTLLDLSAGEVRAREVWFTHAPVSALSTYQGYFGATVKFGQKANGLVVPSKAIDAEMPGADPQLYELATYFIEANYPPHDVDLSTRVSTLIKQLLPEGRCTHGDVAATLGMHPRTLQRRLKAEGESFETIRDAVRRDLAIRCLKQLDLPLIRVAEMLGYTDSSVLTRSCYRWFSASPRQMRMNRMDTTGMADKRP